MSLWLKSRATGSTLQRAWAQDPAIDLWALDEVHFCQHGSRCRMWVPWEDSDPVLWHYPGRKSVGCFGAVRLRDGCGLFQKETGLFEGQTCWNFLRNLRQASADNGRRVVVIIDNAKYHHAKLHQAWRTEQEPDFVLDYLPPYSPELNPPRTGLEANAAAMRPQCLLSNLTSLDRKRGPAIYRLVQTQ